MEYRYRNPESKTESIQLRRGSPQLRERLSEFELRKLNSNYKSTVIAIEQDYYALLMPVSAFDEQKQLRGDFIVMVVKLDWLSLSNPVCAFVR
jgi:hypothetical protein